MGRGTSQCGIPISQHQCSLYYIICVVVVLFRFGEVANRVLSLAFLLALQGANIFLTYIIAEWLLLQVEFNWYKRKVKSQVPPVFFMLVAGPVALFVNLDPFTTEDPNQDPFTAPAKLTDNRVFYWRRVVTQILLFVILAGKEFGAFDLLQGVRETSSLFFENDFVRTDVESSSSGSQVEDFSGERQVMQILYAFSLVILLVALPLVFFLAGKIRRKQQQMIVQQQ